MMGRLLPLLTLLLLKFVDCKDIVVVNFAYSDATIGVVKVRVNGSPISLSRTICWDSFWGLEEANVTCHQMGFLNATSTVAASDSGVKPIIFNVSCSGTETNLADCSYSLSGSCQRKQYVNVTCLRNPGFDGLFDVRLNGPAAHKGVVETRQAYYGNIKQPWYAQCYGLWSKENSEVICRQLGYSGVKATTRITGSLPNVADGELKCTGTEQTLEACPVTGTTSCTNKADNPQVECNLDRGSQQPFDVRLTNGKESAGTVELLKYGRWGVICDRKDGEWNLANARVVCQQLGFVDVIRVTEPAEFGQGNSSIHLRNPGCKGDEWSIEKCPIPLGWGGGTKACQTKDTAGVVCSPERFPAYDISSTLYAPNAPKSLRRFFLHSPGFPQPFNYEAQSHLMCIMTTETTMTEFSLYIHYKRFHENHIETLSFQAMGTQPTSSTFYLLELYGDDSDHGPYTTKTTSLTMKFRSNGAKGSGKFRLEIRVPNGTDVSLQCSSSATPTSTTVSSTSATSVTSQGNPTTTTNAGSTKGGVTEPITTPVSMTTDQTNSTSGNPTTTTTVMVTNTTTDTTAGSTKGGITEPVTTPVSMTTDQTNSTSVDLDGVVGGLGGAIILALLAIILGVVLWKLWKLGLVRFGKTQSPRPASDTEGYDDTRVEFTEIGNESAYANVETDYVNNAFVLDGVAPTTGRDPAQPRATGHHVLSHGVLGNELEAPYDYVEPNTIQRPGHPKQPAQPGNASPYANVDVSSEKQSRLHGQVPEAPYDDVSSVGPHNTAESQMAKSGSNQAGVHGLTPSHAAHSEESPYAHLDPVDHREYVDFRELSPEQLRPI